MGGVEVENPDWTPVAYDLSVVIPGDLSTVKHFILHERISLHRRCKQAEEKETLVRLHCGFDYLNIVAVHGAAVASKDTKLNRVEFTIPAEASKAETYTFSVSVLGSYRTDMCGFYKSCYNDGDGVKRTILSTHFEPISARFMFLCVDEPSVRCDFTAKVALLETKENTEEGVRVVSGGALKTEFPLTAIPADETATTLRVPYSELFHEGVVESFPDPSAFSGATFSLWSFDTVPKISTYLCVFLVGPMEFVEASVPSKAFGTIPIRYYIPNGTPHKNIKFSLSVAEKAFGFFENFFNPTHYPLPKLDFAAIPQFSIGGEESFGLIMTYDAVILDEQAASLQMKRFIAELVSHELSHNWFGDIVSIKFWSGLYLKEGFATYFGYNAAEHIYPEWEPMEQSFSNIFNSLSTDGHVGTHALESEILDEGKIVESFDAISYNKGLALVAMLASFLGPAKFQQGLASYIKSYATQSTTTAELWEALEAATKEPIADVMNDYVNKPGHPTITATVSADGKKLVLQQKKFHTLTAAATSRLSPTLEDSWKVPVSVVWFPENDSSPSANHTASVVMQRGEAAEVDVPMGCHEADFLVNADHTGFFRSNYAEGTWLQLAKSYAKFPERARRGLLEDLFALLESGDVTHVVVDAFIHAVADSKEASLNVLQAYGPKVSHYIGLMGELLKPTDPLLRAAYEPFTRQVIEGRIGSVTVADEEPRTTQLRPLCWRFTVKYAELRFLSNEMDSKDSFDSTAHEVTEYDAEVLSHVQHFVEFSKTFLKTLKPKEDAHVDSNMLPVALPVAIRYDPAPEASAELIWEALKLRQDTPFVRAALAALGSTRNRKLFEEFLSAGIAGKTIHSQYGGSVFLAACSNRTCSSLVWPMFKEHFKTVEANWGSGQFRVQMICEEVGGTLEGEEAAQEWVAFFEAQPLPNANLAITRSEERIRLSGKLKELLSL